MTLPRWPPTRSRAWIAARALGFEGLAARQRAALDVVWARADIELDGDPEIQHALRYALFQLHQNTACAAGRAIPAKGLTGPGYNGHTFWDTEIFLLPVLTYCAPQHEAEALRWRASTLPQAQAKARRLGLRGAAFPWRTIAGEECSGYLPAGTAAFHVNADIAHAVTRYVAATGDERFEREAGAPLLVETARLWASLGYHDERRGGRFSIDGVTGPDEYSALVDNNLYTNLMAQANLRAAADAVERHGGEALGVEPGEVTAWRRAADAMTIPYDAELGVHLQDEDFARHAPFDFEATPPEHYPLLLHVPYFQLYRRQVVKQPDLVLAMALRGDAFTAEEKRAQLRPLRGADRARLLAGGRHPGRARRRGRRRPARLRLPRRGGAARPPRHRAQHRRRPAPRRPRRRLDGRHRRAGGNARARRSSFVRPSAAGLPGPNRLPVRVPRPAPARRDHGDQCHV